MWTYRVVKQGEGDDMTYGIHEAYDDGDRAMPHSITQTPVALSASSPDELADVLDMMRAALTLPVLDHDAFPPE